jgi:hypothetical protein
MAIRFDCLCGQKIKAPDNAAGLKVRCPRCGEQQRVPMAFQSRPDPLTSGSWISLVKLAKADRPKGPDESGGGKSSRSS